MANVSIMIYYDPEDGQWSMTADGATVSNDNIVHLKEQGNTSIQWGIAFRDGVVSDEEIEFSTDANAPGIQFTGTPPWPGTTPNGNANNWNASLNNAQNGQQYYFKVNAVLTDGDGNNDPISWDPEVEEDPPRVAA